MDRLKLHTVDRHYHHLAAKIGGIKVAS